jgi:AcrR family transcriptional regulator
MPKPPLAAKRPRQPRLSTELRLEQILEEATGIIAQQGYVSISVQELADRCRISKTLLLYHFGSKDRLLVALLQFRVSRDMAALSWLRNEIPAQGELTLKSVHKALHAIVVRAMSQPEIVRFYAMLRAEALNPEHPARQFFLDRDEAARSRFEEILARHVPQPEFTARQLIALMMGLEEQWLREDKKFDLLKHWDHAVAQLLPLSE